MSSELDDREFETIGATTASVSTDIPCVPSSEMLSVARKVLVSGLKLPRETKTKQCIHSSATALPGKNIWNADSNSLFSG